VSGSLQKEESELCMCQLRGLELGALVTSEVNACEDAGVATTGSSSNRKTYIPFYEKIPNSIHCYRTRALFLADCC
jgi:hypothetical protein